MSSVDEVCLLNKNQGPGGCWKIFNLTLDFAPELSYVDKITNNRRNK